MNHFPNALVTGGGRRIGATLVRRCAEMGFAVWIHARNSVAEAEALRTRLPHPERHCVTVCDLGDPAARTDWLATLPNFALVVNNASVYRLTATGEPETAEQRNRYWEVNFEAPLAIIQHQFDLQPTPSGGAAALAVNLLDADILNATGGLDAAHPVPAGADSYRATRAALGLATLRLGKMLAAKLRVNGIAPGPVLPPVDCPGPGMVKILAKVPTRHPVGVEEIAGALEFFWRTPSATGVILPVDGGMHLGA